jgi:hypothetical protein
MRQTTKPNPSQSNGNRPPAVPPIHAAAGVCGDGNGPKPPYFDGRREASADLSSKVRPSAKMPGANDGPPPARSTWSDTR